MGLSVLDDGKFSGQGATSFTMDRNYFIFAFNTHAHAFARVIRPGKNREFVGRVKGD